MMDNVLLLISLIAFALLVVGWMMLPDAPAHSAESHAAMPKAVRTA
jgi:hypothetical protein